MNADIQYVVKSLKASNYYKWLQVIFGDDYAVASLWEKGGHSRLYIKIGESQLGYFDLVADKYVGIQEEYANQIVSRIAAQERGSLEALAELIDEDEGEEEAETLPEPTATAAQTPVPAPDGRIEWLKGKSKADQIALMSDDPTPYGWTRGYPRVSAEEAQALREGKPYELKQIDLERLSKALWIGCDGNPENDPFIIKGLANGYLMENPRYAADKEAQQAQIAELAARYGEGEYSVGVGDLPRWKATDKGKAFAREILGDDFVDWK